MTNKKKVIITGIVLCIAILSFTFYNNAKKSKVNVDKKENINSSVKTITGSAIGKIEDKGKTTTDSASGKAEDKGKTTEDSLNQKVNDLPKYKGTISGYVKDATIGALVKVEAKIDEKEDKNVFFYQVFQESKPISNVAQIANNTTVYPIRNVGDTVTIRLFDKDKKPLTNNLVKLQKYN